VHGDDAVSIAVEGETDLIRLWHVYAGAVQSLIYGRFDSNMTVWQ
jgi:uncharacterized protein (UPF0218 family)